MSAENTCELCEAERLTSWHFEDETCWLADCVICGTPMIVWREHGHPSPEEETTLLERLGRIAEVRYPNGYWVDKNRRRIPDHWHAHARPAGGFFDPRRP